MVVSLLQEAVVACFIAYFLPGFCTGVTVNLLFLNKDKICSQGLVNSQNNRNVSKYKEVCASEGQLLSSCNTVHHVFAHAQSTVGCL